MVAAVSRGSKVPPPHLARRPHHRRRVKKARASHWVVKAEGVGLVGLATPSAALVSPSAALASPSAAMGLAATGSGAGFPNRWGWARDQIHSGSGQPGAMLTDA